MSPRLSLATLDQAAAKVRRPGYDVAGLGVGIVHLGPGAFHRAHQAVFTEDAIRAAGGDWGVAGLSLRRADTAEALAPQDGLYAVETLSDAAGLRIVGVLRRTLAASAAPEAALNAMAAPGVSVISLTVTEKAYRLDSAGGLDLAHAEIVHDLGRPARPASTVGWLTAGLARRRERGGAPVTVIACDNLIGAGRKLEAAVKTMADHWDPSLRAWIEAEIAFPQTMVDCIVPATSPASRSRIEDALGLADQACVSREAFAQWVIEDRFAGPRPAWERAGAAFVADVAPFERLKLHVLNAAHSALAYLGLPRGVTFVREAIADPELSRGLDALMAEEIAPVLPDLPVADYWRGCRARFANPRLDHRLEQIGEDGSSKLAQRVFPLLIAAARAGRATPRLAAVVRAWLDLGGRGQVEDPQSERLRAWARAGGSIHAALDDPLLFPEAFRTEPALRRAIVGGQC
ncbi:MAG TPA: mannitol dehydrogenase family protein [Caulobacteraceae bacterium]|nr:mannitol dehydrogenase family protein [Caulobacteraceae bacterium]